MQVAGQRLQCHPLRPHADGTGITGDGSDRQLGAGGSGKIAIGSQRPVEEIHLAEEVRHETILWSFI